MEEAAGSGRPEVQYNEYTGRRDSFICVVRSSSSAASRSSGDSAVSRMAQQYAALWVVCVHMYRQDDNRMCVHGII